MISPPPFGGVSDRLSGFVLDGINVIAEITEDDVTNYVRGLTGIIYRETSDGTKTYYVTNNHGDVTQDNRTVPLS